MAKVSDGELRDVGKKVKNIRRFVGWTQEDLADKVGVTRQTIIGIENDKIIPSLTLVVAILGVFLIMAKFNPVVGGVFKALDMDSHFEKIINGKGDE